MCLDVICYFCYHFFHDFFEILELHHLKNYSMPKVIFHNRVNEKKRETCVSRPDNSAKDNSADLKFRQFSQKYADNSANTSDRRSRANVLQACLQRVGLYTKLRAGYCCEAATRA